ncbi:MAG TPA: murein transglycosylase A [Acetobacteraceae bacterium]|nr:murein transglycosylase A [Acetobacteraceae bacterium]
MRLGFRSVARAAALATLAGLSACAVRPSGPPALSLRQVGFDAVPGWAGDRQAEAMPALLRGCERLLDLPQAQELGGQGLAADLGGRAWQWRGVCQAARAVPPGDDAAARRYFETWFAVWRVGDRGEEEARFTGYYEPEVAGSRVRRGPYQVPVLARPRDLVQQTDADGKPVFGRMQGGLLVPYYDRAEIEAGALDAQDLSIVYLSDPVDLFFLQIQGAGRIRLPDGRIMRVAYAGKNGRPYVPIGRLMVERHLLAPDQVSMQSVRAWLLAHPDQAKALMDENPSYVFFRVVPDVPPAEGPPGALGVDLTAGRSAAVDRSFIPLGAPVYVDTTDPLTSAPLQRLALAQDLGTDITGPVRADIFFGDGDEAAARAGHLHASGGFYLLLPRPETGAR